MDLAKKIDSSVYLSDVFEIVEKHLLGAYLCSNIGGVLTAGKITELEVYRGATDRASHAYPNKRTKRTEVMFSAGGVAYVYLVYGMYPQFNVVVGAQGCPDSVLIRALEPVIGQAVMAKRRGTDALLSLTTGPAKLCQALGINTCHNGLRLDGDMLWISPSDTKVPYITTPRIGIERAGADKNNLWRYVCTQNPYISRPIRSRV